MCYTRDSLFHLLLNTWYCQASYFSQSYGYKMKSPCCLPISSVQFSRSLVSDSLWSHGPQHARLPCSSPTPRACSNSCPSSWWWHPTISSSVVPFSSCLKSFLASGSFPISQFFASGGQNMVKVCWNFSISLSNEYSGLISFMIDWLDLLAVQGTLKSFHQHHSSKASVLRCSAFFTVQLSHSLQ